jgi:hypothetical protein
MISYRLYIENFLLPLLFPEISRRCHPLAGLACMYGTAPDLLTDGQYVLQNQIEENVESSVLKKNSKYHTF